MTPPFRRTGDGLRVELRVQPAAGRSGIDGLRRLDDGISVIKLRVTAPAEGGKANAAVIALLAKAWKLPKSALSIAGGAAARRKTLSVEGDPDGLARFLSAWCKELAE